MVKWVENAPLKLAGLDRFLAGPCRRLDKRYLLLVQPRGCKGIAYAQCCHWLTTSAVLPLARH